jgi:hypothetical protein
MQRMMGAGRGEREGAEWEAGNVAKHAHAGDGRVRVRKEERVCGLLAFRHAPPAHHQALAFSLSACRDTPT